MSLLCVLVVVALAFTHDFEIDVGNLISLFPLWFSGSEPSSKLRPLLSQSYEISLLLPTIQK